MFPKFPRWQSPSPRSWCAAGRPGLSWLCARCFRAGAVRGAVLAAARAGGAAPGAGGEGRAAAQPGARRRRGGDALQDGLPPGQQVSRGWHTPGARPARGEARLRRQAFRSARLGLRGDGALPAQPACPAACALTTSCFWSYCRCSRGRLPCKRKHSSVPAALHVCTEVKIHTLSCHIEHWELLKSSHRLVEMDHVEPFLNELERSSEEKKTPSKNHSKNKTGHIKSN